MSDLQRAQLSAHQANIERYRPILGTHLTAAERRFVLRRLGEEHAALEQLAKLNERVALSAK
jgi:hypothetical protein